MRALAVLGLLAACGPRTSRPASTGDVPWATSGVDWSAPPAVRDAAWTPPAITETTLANGIRVIVVENHRLPLVAMTVIHHAAGSRTDGAQLGLAALTADLLDDGAAELGSTAFARLLDRNGARLDSAIATDYASQQLIARSRDLGTAIDLLASTIRKPRFDDAEVVRIRDARVAQLAAQESQTRRGAAQLFDRLVFGSHPYGQPAEGARKTLSRLTATDVRVSWQRGYRPDTMTVIAAGDVTLPILRAQIDRAFGDWTAPQNPPEPVPALAAYTPDVGVADVRGATEVNVIVGHRAPGVTEADTLAAEVQNSLIGGGTDGALDRELHVKRGLTFGVSSSFWRGEAGGSWALAATFSNANAETGLRAIVDVLDHARTTEPTTSELERARHDMLVAAQLSFETTTGAVRAIEGLVIRHRPLDSFATLAARLARLTPIAVRDALPLTELSFAFAGDNAVIERINIPKPTPP